MLPRAVLLTVLVLALLATPAHASSARLEMRSSGDFVGDGDSYSYRMPGTTAYVHGDRRGIRVVMDDWQLQFFAPIGGRLREREYRHVRRYPFNGHHHPGLAIFGHGRSCNTVQGRFDIRELRLAPHDRVRAFRVRFVQRCDGKPGALRGSFSYRGS